MPLSRRAFLSGTLAAAFAPRGQAWGDFHRAVGEIIVRPVIDGLWLRKINSRFVRNASFATVRRALAEASMPKDTLAMPIVPLLMESSGRRFLLDCGTGGQLTSTSLAQNLAAAGIRPDSIEAILVSNFHPDHIDGLKSAEDRPVFASAEVLVHEAEWNFWMDDGNLARAKPGQERTWFLNARRVFRGMKRVTKFTPGRELVPGITPLAAPGHTPGHVAYQITSGSEAMIALCDVTNHPALTARHPDWQPVVDMDGPRAVATRHRFLDQVSADRTTVHGYHFPYPAIGRIERRTTTGYEFVAAA
jgi:glyoxylase-like metal-dependent hydrolase (beta-lactamase superfamily II)